jgi:hypothetical protein
MMRPACASGTPALACPVFHSREWVAGMVVLLAGVAGSAARAAPPENADPALAPWFQSLQAPNGTSCCSLADCRMTDYRTKATGYEAFVDNRWIAVPRDRVLDHVANPTGRAVVCYMPSMGILCFVRPSET